MTAFILGMCCCTTVNAQTKLKIAACQFPVTGDIKMNSQYIQKYIREAALNGADIIQFSEQALSGYPPVDIPNFENYNWPLLRSETTKIMQLASEHNIWVVLGSTH